MSIRLRKVPGYHYSGKKIAYDITFLPGEESYNKFNVTITNSNDPHVIGRQLTLKSVRKLLAEYEQCANRFLGDDWFTGTPQQIAAINRYFRKHRDLTGW